MRSVRRTVPFATAFEQTLQALEPALRRGALAGVTGHIAESVTEVTLASLGWTPVWHFVGPGRHGVDLLMLGPSAERLFAVEVKGTLRPRHWPRLHRAKLTQMAVEWLDKTDNPAMSEWSVASDDVYGAIVLVNFHDLLYKVALTNDFINWRPVDSLEQLEELEWLGSQRADPESLVERTACAIASCRTSNRRRHARGRVARHVLERRCG